MLIICLVASYVCWSFVKPDGSRCISVGNMLIDLLAIGLVYSLKSRFSRDIGQKFCRYVGSLPGLGKVIIKKMTALSLVNVITPIYSISQK